MGDARSPDVQLTPREGQYQVYDLEEDTARSAYHYEQDPEFYYTQTGGEWNVYSCLLWDDGSTVTQAQERKLDRLAEVLELERGMHLLDVGCGWGGPLVYLCRRYGVTGHGIAVSARQVAAARERAARYGVGATFELVHWRNLPEVATYDAIYSDEVIVHFHDLEGFFRKCHGLLKSGRAMAHKELHLTHSSYGVLGPIGQHINKVFGFTGNYVTLQHEFQALDAAGFRLKNVVEIPMEHYHKTMDLWLSNIFEHRERLKQITSPVFYQEFRGHLKSYRRLFTTGHMRLDIVGSRKLD